MKRSILIFTMVILSINLTIGQTEDYNTPAIDQEIIKEQKAVIKKVEKQKKKAAKAEKELKKDEKKRKQEEHLDNAIKSKKKSISKNEHKLTGIQQKLMKGEEKGKLSPVDIIKMNSKIEKLISGLAKDKEKLAKLMKKR
ncbi:MAG: hypothetical protein WBM53_05165 [Maribacter sp.]